MERPSNALRCPCGRGWLRVWSQDQTHWCDHTGLAPGSCNGARPQGCDIYSAQEGWVAVLMAARLPYATKAPQADPSGGEA